MLARWKKYRRRAKAARLRREIRDLQSLIQRLEPDIHHKRIMETHNKLTEKRQALSDLTTNRKEVAV